MYRRVVLHLLDIAREALPREVGSGARPFERASGGRVVVGALQGLVEARARALLAPTTDALGEGVARRVSRGFGSIDIAADVASKQLGRIAAAALDFLDDGLGSLVEVPAGRVAGGFLGASGREPGRGRDANDAGAAARGENDAARATARGPEGGSRGYERGGEHAGARARCFVSHDFFSDGEENTRQEQLH